MKNWLRSINAKRGQKSYDFLVRQECSIDLEIYKTMASHNRIPPLLLCAHCHSRVPRTCVVCARRELPLLSVGEFNARAVGMSSIKALWGRVANLPHWKLHCIGVTVLFSFSTLVFSRSSIFTRYLNDFGFRDLIFLSSFRHIKEVCRGVRGENLG